MTTLDTGQRSAAKQALLERRLGRLKAGTATPPATIARRPDGEPPPLSYAQERLWFMEQFAPGTAAYGTPLILEFGPQLDLDALAGALRDLVARHESLRMRFPATEDGRPTVVIDPPGDVPLQVSDVADERAAGEAATARAMRPFDLTSGPLLRVEVLRRAAGANGASLHTVLVDLHHILTDGWSNDLLLADLAQLYRARRDGRPNPLAELPVGYGDFARWQREQVGAGGRYWLEHLRGVPALELATDAPRPARQTFDGESHRFILDAELVQGLTDLGRRHRATLFMTMLAGYQALLGRYTRQSDFAVGSPVAGRSAPELDGVVGMFVNMLPLRADLDGDPTGDQLVARTRDRVLDALAHQDVPLEKVINELGLVRDVSRSPLFQTMFVLQNYDRPDQADEVGVGTDIGWRPVELPATRYDLELHAYATVEGGLRCRLVYNTALFTEATVARMATHLTTLLRDLVERPGTALSRQRLLDDAERALALDQPSAAFPVTDTLPSLFERQAARRPDATAVTCDGEHLTYGELNRRANRLAHHLRRLGVRPDDRVALCLDRGLDMVVGILAVLKAGGGYVPLDPAHPAERLRFILGDIWDGAGAGGVLVTQRAMLDRLPEHGATVVLVEDEPDEPDSNPEPVGGPQRLAYVIYTSGSTGQPKGVLVEHRQVVRLLAATDELFDFDHDDVWALLHSYAFDFSVWELWGALAKGGRVVVVPGDVVRDHDRLLDVLRTEQVTVLNQTPPAFRGLRATLTATGRSFRDLAVRMIVFGGDALHVRELDQWFAEHGDQRPALVNMYGITETTVHVTFRRITVDDLAGGASSPIGRPLPDLRGYVLDEHRQPVPVGVPGELHVAGDGLARGYLNRPELTAERFVHEHGERLYRTGDLVRRLASGELDYLGRIDQQVKVRGYRIELGEISSTLERHPSVRTAVVVADDDGHGDRRLVAYVVPAGAAVPTASELRDHLTRTLPKYFVPAAFVLLDSLPLTPNGKLDRKALPAPTVESEGEYVAPRTDLERRIAEIWCEVLGTERVGIDDDFFVLGGHSLLATQVVAKLRRHTEGQRQVGVVDLFQQPTVRGLAALVQLADSGEAGAERQLLYELTRRWTKAVQAQQVTCSYVCVPYGGGSAVVYQPIADAMPTGHALYSVAIPGHDVGLDEDALPFDELARRCTEEILEQVEGPLVLYGHCGVGGALIIELARRLEAAGRDLEAVYVGGIFPFAMPKGRLARLHQWIEDRASNRTHANWLKAMGVDMDEIDPAQADRIISNMRRDGHEAEEHFTALLDGEVQRLRAPVITVVGEQDPVTDYYQERYREWLFITDAAAAVVLDEAGHFFLRYRADELATIITTTHRLITTGREAELARGGAAQAEQPRWWLHGVSRRAGTALDNAPAPASAPQSAPAEVRKADRPDMQTARPTMRRFAAVSAGQLVSTVGSSLTAWAIPVWVLQETGSVMLFSLTGVLAFIPLLVALPLAGAVADRFDRRRVMMLAGAAAASTEALFAVLLWTGRVPLSWVFPIVLVIGFAATFQRMAFISAIPQLVPKRFLSRANGVAQLINGIVLLSVPVLAAGLLGLIGLSGILAVDLISYAFALSVLAVVRFPALMGRLRKETFGRQLLGGLRMSWGQPHFRAMLLYFAVGNLLFAPALLLITPLVLAFDTLGGVGKVALAEGAGAMVGAFTIMLWGGPRRRRMRAIMFLIATGGLFVALTGMRPSLELIMLTVFVYTLVLAMADGIYLTIIEVKIPQRYHARVIALNQAIAWSTIPIGFIIIGQVAGPVFEPLLANGGSLADSVGSVIGTGDGRGIAFIYIVFGLAMIANALGWLAVRRLRRLDLELPDALPDDLVGVQTLAEREARS